MCLRILVQNHASDRSPGVKVTELTAGGECAKAGMFAGSALISVCGKAVRSHQHAIQLLESESTSDSMQFLFEVVVREPEDFGRRAVVQSL